MTQQRGQSGAGNNGSFIENAHDEVPEVDLRAQSYRAADETLSSARLVASWTDEPDMRALRDFGAGGPPTQATVFAARRAAYDLTAQAVISGGGIERTRAAEAVDLTNYLRKAAGQLAGEPGWDHLTPHVEQYNTGRTVTWTDDGSGLPVDPPDRGPAVTAYGPFGGIDGEQHRDRSGRLQDPGNGEAAATKFGLDGRMTSKSHYAAGQLQDPGNGRPAMTEYGPGGNVTSQSFRTAGEIHRAPVVRAGKFPVPMPASVSYHDDGSIAEVHYWDRTGTSPVPNGTSLRFAAGEQRVAHEIRPERHSQARPEPQPAGRRWPWNRD
jgi:hypothetical protein